MEEWEKWTQQQVLVFGWLPSWCSFTWATELKLTLFIKRGKAGGVIGWIGNRGTGMSRLRYLLEIKESEVSLSSQDFKGEI